MKVTVFTKENCQPCRLTKKKLDELGIEYDERDAEAHLDIYNQLGATREAPLVMVTHEDDDMAVDTRMVNFWTGYKPDWIKGLV